VIGVTDQKDGNSSKSGEFLYPELERYSKRITDFTDDLDKVVLLKFHFGYLALPLKKVVTLHLFHCVPLFD
jgi:hypothetical protein